MPRPDICPLCGSDLTGEPIQQEYIDKGWYGDLTHYSRMIAVYDIALDRTVEYQCPDCGGRWPREGQERSDTDAKYAEGRVSPDA